jgi:hypothetical protein
MTLNDLRVSLNNLMPTWCDIESDPDTGEIVIRTGLVEVNGQLEKLEDHIDTEGKRIN